MVKRKIMLALSSAFLLSSASLAATLEQRVDELEQRVDENELAAALSKVKFGLDFNTSVNNFYIRGNKDGDGIGGKKYNNRWIMGLYLNMNADINKYTKFTGRISMTKAFGDLELMHGASNIGSLDAGRGVMGGAALFVERAYVDIYMGKYAALTLGRLPGTDGPGSNLRNSSARMSTYPALAVNGLGDGVVLTLKPYTDAAFRAGFSKIHQPLNMTEWGGAGSIFGSSNEINDANLFFGAFETPFLPKSFGNTLFMLTYVNLPNYAIPGSSIEALKLANPQLGTLLNYPDGSGKSRNVGDMQYINAHIESTHFLNSGLSFFVSASYYIGKTIGSNITLGQDASQTTRRSPTLNKFLFANENAYAVHTGLRYDFSSFFKLGYEYFMGSDYWYAFSRVSINDPFNFRATRGYVHDVYAIFQIDLNQFFRLSYTQINENKVTPLIPMATSSTGTTKKHNVALAYILRF